MSQLPDPRAALEALVEEWREKGKADARGGVRSALKSNREYYGLVNAAFTYAECADELDEALASSDPPAVRQRTVKKEIMREGVLPKSTEPTSVPRPPSCADCGCELNDGTAKCFTVCDDCWDRHWQSVARDGGTAVLRHPPERPTTVTAWRESAEVLARASRNPRNGEVENARLDEGSSTLRFCAEQLEALIALFKEMRTTSEREMHKQQVTHGSARDAAQRKGEVGTLNVVIAELEALAAPSSGIAVPQPQRLMTHEARLCDDGCIVRELPDGEWVRMVDNRVFEAICAQLRERELELSKLSSGIAVPQPQHDPNCASWRGVSAHPESEPLPCDCKAVAVPQVRAQRDKEKKDQEDSLARGRTRT